MSQICLLNIFFNQFLHGHLSLRCCSRWSLQHVSLWWPPLMKWLQWVFFLHIFLTCFFPWCVDGLSHLILFCAAILFQHSAITWLCKPQKTTSFSMPWLTFIINNMILIEMNIRILRLVIPLLVVFGSIMVMRACLSSFSTIYTVMGWWWCIPIILFPWWFQQCLGSI